MGDWYEKFGKNRGIKKQRDGDFQEEDVWGIMKIMRDQEEASEQKVNPKSTTPSQKVKMISNPVNIVTTNLSKHHYDDHVHENGEDDEEDDDEVMVPPHEHVARRQARNQVASFSMCEGAGRTLKGRDLRKMRDIILTKTGFLEK